MPTMFGGTVTHSVASFNCYQTRVPKTTADTFVVFFTSFSPRRLMAVSYQTVVISTGLMAAEVEGVS